MELLTRAAGYAVKFLCGAPMLLLMGGTGLLLTLRTRFVQLRRFGKAMRAALGGASRQSEKTPPGAVSPRQALSTALSATLGTGNIAGVAGAVALGGPGAVFWMWVSAFLGMATKYAEVMLAVRYREKNAGGEYVGGPMYYIKNGLGRRFYPLAKAFAAAGLIASVGTGNLVQANTIAAVLAPGGALWLRLCLGLLTAGLALYVSLGGLKRTARAAEGLVPLAAGAYIACALWVIIVNRAALLPALGGIVRGAFSPESLSGGAFGVTLSKSISYGAGRGVFSNEAGMGTSPIAHAACASEDPDAQGLSGIFEVFADTMVVCTLTALAILTGGEYIPYGRAAGAELTVSAFASVLGAGAARAVIAGGLVLFAFSTILGWALYGRRCLEFLGGGAHLRAYLLLYSGFTVIGAAAPMSAVWDAASALNGLMALPNLLALCLLSGEAAECSRRGGAVRGRAKRESLPGR